MLFLIYGLDEQLYFSNPFGGKFLSTTLDYMIRRLSLPGIRFLS